MTRIELPAGEYLHHCKRVRPGRGGRTRVVLMRARYLAEYGGVRNRITTIDPAPIYDEVRRVLTGQGLLAEPVQLVNLYEHYRTADLAGRTVLHETPPPVDGLTGVDEPHPDGTIHRTVYTRRAGERPAMVDFLRPDGSPYLRHVSRRVRPPYGFFLLDEAGRVVGRWRNHAAWERDWLAELTGDSPAFVITDRPEVAVNLTPLPSEQFSVIELMHNPHVGGERRWDSKPRRAYRHILNHVDTLDGLVCLTDRQRQDLSARVGGTNNLFVVPNPVEAPARPEPEPTRDPHRFAILARLKPQKQIGHALRAFALARADEPAITLDIYGDGVLRPRLEAMSRRLGVNDAVTFHGYEPGARDTLRHATAYLMTSRFEGYPLATLEAMSHGCPVISYDLKYGPRDQIADGVDGFLVEPGDLRGFADRMLALARDPDLQRTMGRAAVDKAHRHDAEAFVRDWKHVFETVRRQQPDRVRLRSGGLALRRLRITESGRAELVGYVWPRGLRPRTALASATVTVDAIAARTGEIATVPTTLTRTAGVLRIAATFDPADLFAGGADPTGQIRLRVRFVCRNVAWQQTVGRVAASHTHVLRTRPRRRLRFPSPRRWVPPALRRRLPTALRRRLPTGPRR